MKAEQLDPQQLIQVWQGEVDDEFAEATVIGTGAIALQLLGKAESQQQAHQLAEQFWLNRNLNRFS
jgi:uncharacterized protein YqfB (UPF0267 family)